MKQVEERYISLLTDFGFKRIFGTAMNKNLLICFLNSFFNGRQVVKGRVVSESRARRRQVRWHIVISKNSIDTAKQEGKNEKALEIAKNMLADGVDINLIKKYSGLTQEQIEKMK